MKFLQKLFLLLAFLFLAHISFAQDRFWTGNGANDNWNNTANWSATSGGAASATVPTAANNVIFDNNSFTGSIIVNANNPNPIVCNSFTWTATTGTLTGTRRIHVSNNFTITPQAGVAGFTSDIRFLGTAGHSVNLGNHTNFPRDIRFDGVGGTWTVTGNIDNSRDVQLFNGTVIINGNVSAGDDLDINAGNMTVNGTLDAFDDIDMDGGILTVTGNTTADDVFILNGVATFTNVNVFDDFRLEPAGTTNDVTVTGLVITTGSINPEIDIEAGILKGGDYLGRIMTVRNGATAQNIRSVGLYFDMYIIDNSTITFTSGNIDVTRDINIRTGSTATFGNGLITVGRDININTTATTTFGVGAINIGNDLDIGEVANVTLGTGAVTIGNIVQMDEAIFDTNNQDITIGRRFDCNSTAVRTLTLGASTITMLMNAPAVNDDFDLRNGTLTFSQNSATIVFTGTGERRVRVNDIAMTLPNIRVTNGNPGDRLLIYGDTDDHLIRYTLQELDIQVPGQSIDINNNTNRPVTFSKALTLPANTSFEIDGLRTLSAGDMTTLGNIFQENVDLGAGADAIFRHYTRFEKNFSIDSGTLLFSSSQNQNVEFQGTTTLGVGDAVDVNFNGESDTGAANGGNYTFLADVSIANNSTILFDNNGNGAGINSFATGTTITVGQNATVSFNNDGTGGAGEGENHFFNVTLSPGVTWMFHDSNNGGVNTSSFVYGNFLVPFDCANPVTIRSFSTTDDAQVDFQNQPVPQWPLGTSVADINNINAAVMNTNSIDVGNNTNINFPAAAAGSRTLYWIAAGNTDSWNNVANWSTTSGGTPDVCTPPTINDDVFFDANSFSILSATVNLDVVAECRGMDWTGSTNTPNLFGASTLTIGGSVALSAGMTNTATGDVTFVNSTGTNVTLETFGESFGGHVTFNATSAWILVDGFKTTRDLRLIEGTFDTNGQTLEVADDLETNNNNTRSLIFDNSAVTIGGYTNSGNVDFRINGNNITFSATGTASITFVNIDPTNDNINLDLYGSIPKTLPNLIFDDGTGAIVDNTIIDIDNGNNNIRNIFNDITIVQLGHNFSMNERAVEVQGTLTIPDQTIADIRTRNSTTINSIFGDVVIGENASVDFGLGAGGFFEFTTGTQITVGASSTVRFNNNEPTVSNTFANISLLEASTFLFSRRVTSNIIDGALTTQGGCVGRVVIDSDDGATAAIVNIINQPSYPIELNAAQVGNITAQGSVAAPFYIRSLNGLDAGNNTAVEFTSDPTPRTLYWVGAGPLATTSNWSDCNNWSLSSGGLGGILPPDDTDNAIFDVNSFSIASATVIIDTPTLCDDITWTAGVTNNPLLTGASDMNIFGSVDIQATMQPIATNMTGLIKLQSTGADQINMPSNSFLNVEIRGSGGIYTMASNFTVENTLTLVAGTLDTQNLDLTVGNFDANQVLTRSLILGNSTMIVTEGLLDFQGNTNTFTLSSNPAASITFTTATSVVVETGNFAKTIPDLIFTNPTNIDFNNTTPDDVNLITFGNITVSQAAASTIDFNGALPKTFGNILLADNTTGAIGGASTGLTNTFSGTVTLGNSNTITLSGAGNNDFNANVSIGNASTLAFANVGGDTNEMINLTLNRASTISFNPTATNNLTGAITVNTDCSAPAIINSSTATVQATLTLTSNQDLFNTFVQDINVAGATLNAATVGADLGNNAGNITFNSTPRTLYWVGKQGVAPNSNWSEAGNWSLATGGLAGECPPTINDDVFFDANSFSVASATVTMDLANTYARNMDWTGATNTPALVTNSINQTLNLGGNLKFIPAMTLGNGNISDSGGAAPTIGSLIFASVISDGNTDYTIDMGDVPAANPATWTKRFRRVDFNANLVENLPATTWILESPFAVTRHWTGLTRGGIYLVAGSFATDGFDMEARYITANTGPSGFNIAGFGNRVFDMTGSKIWIRGTDTGVFGGFNLDFREDGNTLNLISDATSNFQFDTNATYSIHLGQNSKTIPDILFSNPSTTIKVDDTGLTAGQVITFNAFEVQEANIDVSFIGDAQKIFLEPLTFLDNTTLYLQASSDITQRNDFQGILTLGTGSVVEIIGANDYVGLNILEGVVLNFNGTGNHDFQTNAAPITANLNSTITFNNTQAAPNINTFDQVTMFGGVTWAFGTTTNSEINNIIIDPSVDCTNLVTITSNAPPTQAIVNFNNPLTLTDVNINNINNTGALVTVNSFIFGGNNIGNFLDNTLDRQLFWVGNTGSWNDPAHWSLASGGIGGECPPRIIDDVVFDANSFSAPAQTVTVEDFPVSAAIDAEAKSINFTGTTNSPTFASIPTSTLEVGGDFTLIAPASLTWSFNEPVTFSHETGSLVAANITMAGQSLDNHAIFDGRLDQAGDGWIFLDAFATQQTIFLDNGDLNFNSQNVTANRIDVDADNNGTGANRSLNTDNSQMTITGNSGVVLDLRGNDNTFTFSSTATSVMTFTGTGNIDMQLGSTAKTMPQFIYDRPGGTSATSIDIFTSNSANNRMTFRNITSLDNGTGSTDFNVRGNMAKYYENITLLDGMDAVFSGITTATFVQGAGNFFNIGNGLEAGFNIISGTFTIGDDTELDFQGTNDFRQAVTIGTTVNTATGATFNQSLFRSTFDIASGSTMGNIDLTFNNNTEFRDDVHIWGGGSGTSSVDFNDDVRLQGTGVCNAPFPAADVLGDGVAPLTFHAPFINFRTSGNTDFGATLTFMRGGIVSNIGNVGANSVTIYRCDVDYLGTGNNATFNSSGGLQSISYFAEKLNITSTPDDLQSRMTFNGRTYFRNDVTLGSKTAAEGFSSGILPLLPPGVPPINFSGAVDYRTPLAAAAGGNQNQRIVNLGWLAVSGAPATNSGILLDIGQNARVEFTDNGAGQESTFIDLQYDVNCVTNYRNQNNRTFSNIFLTDFNIFNMPNRNIATPLVENSGGLTRVDFGYVVASVGCDAWIRFGSTIAGVQTDLYLDNQHTTVFGRQWVHVDMLDVNVDDGSIVGTPGTFGQAEAASSQDLGNNSTVPTTLNFTIPVGLGAYYWVGDGNNGLWSDPDNWALTSGADGSLGAAPLDDDCIPSSSDNIFFDNNSFTPGNNTVTVDVFQVRGRSITWEDTGAAAVTNNPVLVGSNVHVIEVYGDYNLATQDPVGGAGTMNNAFPGLTHMRGPMVNSGVAPTRIKHIDSNGGRFFGPVLFEGSYDPITSALDSWVIDDEMNVESNIGTGDITIQVGNVDSNNQTISLEGDWTVTLPIVTGGGVNFPAPLFLPTSSTVIFDGNGLNGNLAVGQGISVANVKTGADCVECSDKAANLACATSPFYNIIMNKTAGTAGSRVLNVNNYDISIFNNLDLQVGEMRDNANQIRGNTSGLLTMNNNTKLRIGLGNNEASVFPTCFQTANINLAGGTPLGFVTSSGAPSGNINNASIVHYISQQDQLIAGSTKMGVLDVGPDVYGTLRVSNSVKSLTSGVTIEGSLRIDAVATLRDMGHQIRGNSHNAGGGLNQVEMIDDGSTLILGTNANVANLTYPSANMPLNISVPLAVSSGTSTTFPLFTVGNGTFGNGLVEDVANAGKMNLQDNTTVIYNSSNIAAGQEVLGGFTYRNLTLGITTASAVNPDVTKTIVANPTSSGNLNVALALRVESGNNFKDDGWQITGATGTGGFTMQTGSLLTLDDRAGVSTAFPINYLRADISFANNTEVIYNGDFTQNISKEPVYYDITATAPVTVAPFALVDKKFMPANGAGQSIAIRNDFVINPHNHVWDNGTQINNSIGPAGSIIMNSTGAENGLSKLSIGTETSATQFPTNFTTHVLNDFTTVSYNSDQFQLVKGLNTAGTGSYYDLILTETNIGGFYFKALDGLTTIRNDFTMIDRVFLFDNDFQITGNTTGDMFLGDASILFLGGNFNNLIPPAPTVATIFPTAYPRNQIHLDKNSTVYYYSQLNQIVSGEPTYGGLFLFGQGLNAGSPFAGLSKTFDNSPNGTTYTSATIMRDFEIDFGINAIDNGLQLVGNPTGTMTLQTNSQLTLGAGNLATFFPTLFTSANINLNVGSTSNATVSYAASRSNTTNNAGTLPNTVPEDDIAGSGGGVGPAAYRHLIIESGGVAVTKTLDAGVNVRGNLNIESNNTLDVLSQFGTIGVFDINLGGDWTNNNGTFTMRTGTVILDNDEDGSQSILTNGSPFFKLQAKMVDVAGQEVITMQDMLNIGDGATTDGTHRGSAFFERGIFRPLSVAPIGDTNVNFDNENRNDFNNNALYQKMVFHEQAVVQGTGNFPLPAAFIANGTPNDDSFVDASVMKIGGEDFYFPVGDIAFYAPAGLLDIGSGDGNPEAFSMYYKFDDTGAHDPWLLFPDKLSGAKKISRQEFWMINRSSNLNGTTYDASSTAKVSLSWHANRSGGVGSPSSLQVMHWGLDDASPSPTDLGSWTTRGNNTSDITGGFPIPPFTRGTLKSIFVSSDFSPFTLGTYDFFNILPVELLYFEGEAKEDFVELRWETVSEFENDFFTLEKSQDGINFEAFAQIPSKGEGEQSRQYIDYDLEPFDGLNYYRLKQTDIDGTFTYTKIISVYFSGGANAEESFTLYPNPTDGNVINLGISGIDLENAELMITDMLGRVVYRYKVENPASSVIPIKFYDKLASGNYILKLVTRQKSYAKRFIVE